MANWIPPDPWRPVLQNQPRRMWGFWHVLTMTGDIQPMKDARAHRVFYGFMSTIDCIIGAVMLVFYGLGFLAITAGFLVLLYLGIRYG